MGYALYADTVLVAEMGTVVQNYSTVVQYSTSSKKHSHSTSPIVALSPGPLYCTTDDRLPVASE